MYYRTMSKNVRVEKAQLRSEMMKLRKSLSEASYQEKSLAVCRNIINNINLKDVQIIAGYFPVQHEVNVMSLVRNLLKEGKQIYLPRVENDELHFHKMENDLEIGPYKIPQPRIDSPEVKPENIELFFIPGLAFDKNGNRLGYGKGFYDRLLLRTVPKAQKVGITFDFGVIEKVPSENTDQKMNILVSESHFWQFGQ
jgi:5-formyltetrahydrofolate cyclo-ligase